MYVLERTQSVPISPTECWSFFSNPKNLARLTDDAMHFKVMENTPDRVYEQMIVRFSVAPFAGLRMNWSSVISRVVEEKYFADLQVEGPFGFWHHQHFFKAIDGGVEIRDLLHYLPPFGVLGKLFHPLLVKNKLRETFDYRYRKINELFGSF